MTSTPCWVAVRSTLMIRPWVAAPRQVRLPPHTLRFINRPDAQRRIFDLATHRLLAVVSRSVGRMGEWQDSLRAIANDLGSLQADVAKALTRTLPDVTEEQLTALRPGDVDRQ